MPLSRPMPALGRRCHELRIVDEHATWRLVYRIDDDAIIIVDVFSKKTPTMPKKVLDDCRSRLRRYDQALKGTRSR